MISVITDIAYFFISLFFASTPKFNVIDIIKNNILKKDNYGYCIFKCDNHNKSINSDYCYMILFDKVSRIKEKSNKFKEIYFNNFKSNPKKIAFFYDQPIERNIEYLFRLFYKKNSNYSSYIYSRYSLLYLHKMNEDEFIDKFRLLYEDGGDKIKNRKYLDSLYEKK